MNNAKKRDPRSWKKWRESGAMGSPNFVVEQEGTLVYLHPLRPVKTRQIQNYFKRHGIRAMEIDDLQGIVKCEACPKFDLGMAPIDPANPVKAAWPYPYAKTKAFDPMEV